MSAENEYFQSAHVQGHISTVPICFGSRPSSAHKVLSFNRPLPVIVRFRRFNAVKFFVLKRGKYVLGFIWGMGELKL
jgi:hypothetical protein